MKHSRAFQVVPQENLSRSTAVMELETLGELAWLLYQVYLLYLVLLGAKAYHHLRSNQMLAEVF